MTRKELYNICHDEAVAYANSEQWSKRTGEEKSFLIQGYLDAMMEARKSEITEKKKEYPKTFLACCDVLGIEDTISRGVKGYKSNLLDTFQKLYICRDAYWKLYGEEMGLGKPWEPDWTNLDQLKYCIWVDFGEFTTTVNVRGQRILAFPTAEMRDAFYEVFREEIEICKELL